MRSILLFVSLLFSSFLFCQSLTITSPTEGEELHPFSSGVDITIDVQGFNVANGTGDGHIHWTVQENGGTPEVQPMKYDTNVEEVDTSPGNAYTVYMELVDNNHTPIIPAVNATINFTVASFIVLEFADFTGLRSSVAGNGTGYYAFEQTNVFRITHTDYTTNRIWMEDPDTAVDPEITGMLIYDQFGVFQNPYNPRDIVLLEEFGFKIEINNGVMTLIPITLMSTTLLTGEPEAPQLVTINDFIANHEDYESVLIELQNVTFDDGDEVAIFSAGANYNVTDGSMNTVIKRTDFSTADYIGQLIPSTQLPSLLAIGGENNGTPEIYVRNLSDMTLGIEDFNLNNTLVAYPNPTSNGEFMIKSSNHNEKSIEIYTLLGQRIYKNLVLNNELINVSYLNSGVYILKIKEGAKITSLKLIIE